MTYVDEETLAEIERERALREKVRQRTQSYAPPPDPDAFTSSFRLPPLPLPPEPPEAETTRDLQYRPSPLPPEPEPVDTGYQDKLGRFQRQEPNAVSRGLGRFADIATSPLRSLGSRYADLYGPGGRELENIKGGLGGFAGWTAEALSAAPLARMLGKEQQYENLPMPIKTALDVLPSAIFSGAAGPALSTLPKVGPLLAPVVGAPSFLGRLAAEEAVGTAGAVASQETANRIPESAPGAVKALAPLAAGLLGGGAAVGAVTRVPRAATAITRAAEQNIPGVAEMQLARKGIAPITGGATDDLPGLVSRLDRPLTTEEGRILTMQMRLGAQTTKSEQREINSLIKKLGAELGVTPLKLEPGAGVIDKKTGQETVVSKLLPSGKYRINLPDMRSGIRSADELEVIRAPADQRRMVQEQIAARETPTITERPAGPTAPTTAAGGATIPEAIPRPIASARRDVPVGGTDETYYLRWSNDPQADLKRSTSLQPADDANNFLPNGPLSPDALDNAIASVRDEDFQAYKRLRDTEDSLVWTNGNWATQVEGIPAIRIDGATSEADAIARAQRGGAAVSGGQKYLSVFTGDEVGKEYESLISEPDAVLIKPNVLHKTWTTEVPAAGSVVEPRRWKSTTDLDPKYDTEGVLPSLGIPAAAPGKITPDRTLYHFTPADNLDTVRAEGLQGRIASSQRESFDERARFLRDNYGIKLPGDVVYAADNARILSAVDRDVNESMDWVLLRFQAKEQRWLRDPEFRKTDPGSWYSRQPVEPSRIEMLTDEGWKPLSQPATGAGAAPSVTTGAAEPVRPPAPTTAEITPPPAGTPPSAVPPQPPAGTPPGAGAYDEGAFQNARKGYLSYLRQEAKERRTGKVAEEIAAGRARQFASLEDAVKDALAKGATPREAYRQGLAAMSGRLTNARPLAIDEAQRLAVEAKVTADHLNGTISKTQYLKEMGALDTLHKGEQRLQPHQLDALRRLFGDDMTDLIAKRNQSINPPTVEQRASVEALRQRFAAEAKVLQESNQAYRNAEIQAVRMQRVLDNWDNLTARQVDSARGTAMAAWNKLDEAEIARTRALWGETETAATKAQGREIAKASQGAQRLGESADVQDYRTRLAEGLKAVRAAKAAGDQAALREAETRLRQLIDTAATQTGDDRIYSAAARSLFDLEEMLPDANRWRLRAQSKLNDVEGGSPAMREQLTATMGNWYDIQRTVLDAIPPEQGLRHLITVVSSIFSGNLPDSYLTAAVRHRHNLEATLLNIGVDSKLARRVSDDLFEAILQTRYGRDIPDHVRDVLSKAKSLDYSESLGGLDTFVQRWKNTKFGLLDFGFFGVQMLTALRRGGLPMAIGYFNRLAAAANLPHFNLTMADDLLPKKIRYGLAGVPQGLGGVSPVEPGAGTMFRYLGKPGEMLDEKVLNRYMEPLNNLQFSTLLPDIRNTAYEGNLILMHLFGRNVTDPKVQAKAAQYASMIGSASPPALLRGRNVFERLALTSASMTRAMFAEFGGTILKALGPTASVEERIMAASVVASQGLFLLTVGKIVNDQIGTTDFEFVPGKPHFGGIRLPDGTWLDMLPQATVGKAVGKSISILAKEGADIDIAKEFAKVFLGRASVAGSFFAGFFDTGYEQGRGVQFGDLSLRSKIINMSPLPPVLEQTTFEGFDPQLAGLQFLGASAFPESPYDVQARAAEEAGLPAPTGLSFMEEMEQYQNNPQALKATLDKHDAEKRRDPEMWEYHEAQRTNRDLRDKAIAANKADLDAGKLNAHDYRQKLQQIIAKEAENNAKARVKIEDKLAGMEPSGDKAYAEYQGYLSDLYEKDFEDKATGDFDFDAYDAKLKELAQKYGTEKAAAFETRRRADPNPEVQRLITALDEIKTSGYWDIADKIMPQYLKAEFANVVGSSKVPQTYDEFWPYLQQRYTEYAAAALDKSVPGWRQTTPNRAQTMATAEVEKKKAIFYDGLARARDNFLNTDMRNGGAITKLLYENGYMSVARMKKYEAAMDKPRQPAGVR